MLATLLTFFLIAYLVNINLKKSVFLLSEKDTMDVWCNGQKIETAVSKTRVT